MREPPPSTTGAQPLRAVKEPGVASVPAEDLLPVLAPQPGTDLVPDGWCDAVVVPWLEEQTETYSLPKAAAQLDGMVSAYRTLKSDTFELVKARPFLEIRWGEIGRAHD